MGTGKYLRQLAGESAVYGVSGVVAKVVGLLLIPILTRVFAPSEYGIIALVDVLTGLVGMVAVLGLDNASARWFYDSEEPGDRRSTIGSWFWCQLVVSAILATALFALARFVSVMLTGSPSHANLIRLAAATLPAGVAGKVLGNWLRYQRRPWAAVTFATGSMLGTFGLVILLVVAWRQGLAGLYAARLVSALTAAAICVVLLRNWIAVSTFSWSRLKRMLHFGLPLVPAAVGLWIMMAADRFILKGFCGTREVGLYAIAGAVARDLVEGSG